MQAETLMNTIVAWDSPSVSRSQPDTNLNPRPGYDTVDLAATMSLLSPRPYDTIEIEPIHGTLSAYETPMRFNPDYNRSHAKNAAANQMVPLRPYDTLYDLAHSSAVYDKVSSSEYIDVEQCHPKSLATESSTDYMTVELLNPSQGDE
jgi:hypothetical protein